MTSATRSMAPRRRSVDCFRRTRRTTAVIAIAPAASASGQPPSSSTWWPSARLRSATAMQTATKNPTTPTITTKLRSTTVPSPTLWIPTPARTATANAMTGVPKAGQFVADQNGSTRVQPTSEPP